MSFDYATSAATARRLLARFGQSVTLSLPDTVEDGPPGVEGTTVAGRSVTGAGVKLDYDNREVDGTVILSGDVKVLLEATNGDPEVGMTATLSGKTYRVEHWQPLEPAGTTVMHTLQMRRV